jgi:hypothetical protein
MKRLFTWFAVSALTFCAGLSTVLVLQKVATHQPAAPLQLTVSEGFYPGLGYTHIVTVKNVSGRTVRGYSLGQTGLVGCTDIDGRPYADNTCYTNPVPARALRPGESEQWPDFNLTTNESKPAVWVDLVHFEDGGPNWGENKGHKDSYVRE